MYSLCVHIRHRTRHTDPVHPCYLSIRYELQFLFSVGFTLSSFCGVGFVMIPKILSLAFGIDIIKNKPNLVSGVGRNSSFVFPSQASDESKVGGGVNVRRKSGRSRRLSRRNQDMHSASVHGGTPRDRSARYTNTDSARRKSSVLGSPSGFCDISAHDSGLSSVMDDFPAPSSSLSKENLLDETMQNRLMAAKVTDRLKLTSKIATMEKVLLSMKEELLLMEDKSPHGSKHGNLMMGSGATTNHSRRQPALREDSLHSSLHSTVGNLPSFSRQPSLRALSPLTRGESMHSRNMTSLNSTRSVMSSSRRSSSVSQRSNSAISACGGNGPMMGSDFRTALDESRLNAIAAFENSNHYSSRDF